MVTVVSGTGRRQYPNRDIVYNNSVLYLIENIDALSSSQHDGDLIESYIKSTDSN